VRMWALMDQPTMWRENTSRTAAQYSFSFPGAMFGDVGDPQHVRAGGGEAPVDQIRGRSGVRVTHRATAAPAPVEALDAGLAHQPGDPLLVGGPAQFHRQLGVHPRRTVPARPAIRLGRSAIFIWPRPGCGRTVCGVALQMVQAVPPRGVRFVPDICGTSFPWPTVNPGTQLSSAT
jgi:hypothetical protein